MRYLHKSFTAGPPTREYTDNFDAVFRSGDEPATTKTNPPGDILSAVREFAAALEESETKRQLNAILDGATLVAG